MNRLLLLSGTMFLFAVSLLTSGCGTNLKQEIPSGEYGKIVETLPDLPETKEPMPHPDYVELRHMK
jgi:uncharacterized protein YceK